MLERKVQGLSDFTHIIHLQTIILRVQIYAIYAKTIGDNQQEY